MAIDRPDTRLENLENLKKSLNLRVVREKSGKKAKVRENVSLQVVSYCEHCS